MVLLRPHADVVLHYPILITLIHSTTSAATLPAAAAECVSSTTTSAPERRIRLAVPKHAPGGGDGGASAELGAVAGSAASLSAFSAAGHCPPLRRAKDSVRRRSRDRVTAAELAQG